MVLTRMGNKRRIISDVSKYFPKHKMRIELFFGAGGSFFYLPKPQYSILNDLDDDVTNLYLQIQNNLENLIVEIINLPISETLINYWKEKIETDPLKKAVRFLLLSNFTYLGKGDTLRLGLDNTKKNILKNINFCFQHLKDSKIVSRDFREVLKLISFSKTVNDKDKCFVYLDPCYLDTENNYKTPNWSNKDTTDCLDIMVNCGIKCAMSEFNHPFVIAEAHKRGLNVITIGKRRNLKNKRIEILIINYTIENLFT